MPRKVNDEKENLKTNLEYIGLKLERIPKFLKEFEAPKFRAPKAYNAEKYRVYRYIDMSEIEIMISPVERLAEIQKRYKMASPICEYLDDTSEENLEKHATFLKMIMNINIARIQEIEKEQEKFNQEVPTKVKYTDNFAWQIFYSNAIQKYFMIVSSKELDNSAMWYVIKKQIEINKTKKKQYLYAPVNYEEYSGELLTNDQIADLENYYWYFTKEWPEIFEVYDRKKKRTIRIVGEANVYEKVKSTYVIVLDTQKEAQEQYKLMKALFIIGSELPEDYQFSFQIKEDGTLQFYWKEEEINYHTLPKFINNQILSVNGMIHRVHLESKELKKELDREKEEVTKRNEEYTAKEQQILAFIECKKTFFGNVKYLFKSKSSKKKMNQVLDQKKQDKKQEERLEEEEKKQEEIMPKIEDKNYTIEDLIYFCSILDKKRNEFKNRKLDLKALKNRKEILEQKIKNATTYLDEIESHRKSLLEFWKYTNKDVALGLNEGEDHQEEEEKREKIKKYFDYESDLEELGVQMDEIQRRKFSKEETDAIYIARLCENSINAVNRKRMLKADKAKLEEELESLKKAYKENEKDIIVADFDIFGGVFQDKTKIQTIRNTQHRETKKNQFKILNIRPEIELDSYKEKLKEFANLIHESFQKVSLPVDLSVYMPVRTEEEPNGIHVCFLNPQDAINLCIKKEENFKLCRIDLKEKMPAIFYTNILFYDNTNSTLPKGMDLSTEVLVDFDKFDLFEQDRKEVGYSYENMQKDLIFSKIEIIEYEADEKR